jgi:hypothetical protein
VRDGERSDTKIHCTAAVGVCRLSKARARPGRLPAAALFSIVFIPSHRIHRAQNVRVSAAREPFITRPALCTREYYLFQFLDLSQCGYPHFPIFRHSCTRLQSAAAAAAADTMRAARALPGASCQILGHTVQAGNLSALQLQHMNHHRIPHPRTLAAE